MREVRPLWAGKGMTEFQRRIMTYLSTLSHEASMWEIAQKVFPEKWSKPTGRQRSGRGVLIAHLRRACQKLDEDGVLVFRNTYNNSSSAGIQHGFVWDVATEKLYRMKGLL